MNFSSLQQSAFLHALGSAILSSLWQGFILWIVYGIVTFSYKNASSRFKNNCSTILLFVSFIWFFTSFISPFFKTENIISAQSFTSIANSFSLTHSASNVDSLVASVVSALPYLSVAYIFLLLFLMAKLFTAYRHIFIISKRGLKKCPFELKFFAVNAANKMGIKNKICVWISEYIDVPATIGFIKPVILIPIASINNLSGHQLEAIILHELSHIKRNDYLINLFISVIETILFFNPFVALLSNTIKRERENCCDDFVLQYQYDPYVYASALLSLEQSRVSDLKLAMGAISGKKQLLSRIKRITSNKVVSRQFNYGQKLLALILVTGVICSVAWLSPQPKKSIDSRIINTQIKSTVALKINALEKTGLIITPQNLKERILKNKMAKTEALADSTLNDYKSLQDIFATTGKDDNNSFFLKGDDNINFNEAIDNSLKPRKYFFNEENFKLPKSITIKNFPFQKMNFSINLGDIYLKELNENLKKAYKGINSIDWNKLQNEINESFPQLNQADISSVEQQAGLDISQKNKAFSELKKAQEQYKIQLDNEVKNEILLQDSLIKSAISLANSRKKQMQDKFTELQHKQMDNLKANFNFDYVKDKDAAISNKKDQLNNSIYNKQSGQKDIKIFIKHLQNISHAGEANKLLQFSFSDDSKKGGDRKIIHIELDSK